ncbi:elongation factor Ts [Candidatus Gracilibacteria bacterium]|nr:elongation factor Ts [Candidatus Gracilibacteria bacterium]NJM87026.1 elongation factor Ts [Hydrococcus sp. RU_2_2]NJP21358.1 elongation factor Ts [Hydrococcus sp. CRU_1_1]NJQ97998.1 elongation factor Ts [Hydrococcus sp. CSU_1_8]
MPGIIESYIHTGNTIGVLVEISCQSDWGARTSELKALAKDIAMQVAACPTVKYVKRTDISTDLVRQEKAIEMSREDLSDQPANVKEKIVRQRVEKRLKEMSLYEQPYIRDLNITVEDLVKLHIAKLSENIQVCRFVRFMVGESANPSPPTSGSGVPRKPLPNPPEPLASEEKLE